MAGGPPCAKLLVRSVATDSTARGPRCWGKWNGDEPANLENMGQSETGETNHDDHLSENYEENQPSLLDDTRLILYINL